MEKPAASVAFQVDVRVAVFAVPDELVTCTGDAVRRLPAHLPAPDQFVQMPVYRGAAYSGFAISKMFRYLRGGHMRTLQRYYVIDYGLALSGVVVIRTFHGYTPPRNWNCVSF